MTPNKTELLDLVRLSLRDKGFYWVKWEKLSDYEIASWDAKNDKFKFTDGGYRLLKDTFEIDTKEIKRS